MQITMQAMRKTYRVVADYGQVEVRVAAQSTFTVPRNPFSAASGMWNNNFHTASAAVFSSASGFPSVVPFADLTEYDAIANVDGVLWQIGQAAKNGCVRVPWGTLYTAMLPEYRRDPVVHATMSAMGIMVRSVDVAGLRAVDLVVTGIPDQYALCILRTIPTGCQHRSGT